MPSTLFIIGNPEPQQSHFAQNLIQSIEDKGHDCLILKDAANDSMHFSETSLNRMRQLMESAQSIVLHVPVYWYAAPALVKSWMDQILSPGWAFPSSKSAIAGKPIALSLTTGSAVESYQSGASNQANLEDYFLPYRRSFEYCGMAWRGLIGKQFPSQGIVKETELKARVEAHTEALLRLVNEPA